MAKRIARRALPSDIDEADSIAGLAVVEVLSRDSESRSWILPTVVRRRVTDELRRRYGRRGERPAPVPLELLGKLDDPIDRPEIADRATGPEDRALAGHEAGRLLSRMTPKEREVFVRLADGERLRDIGDSWGVTEAAVCHVRRRGLKRATRDLGAA